MPHPTPESENERAEALRSYRVLDSPPDLVFDEIDELAAQIGNCKVSYISFIDDDRFWFKSKCGLPPDIFESCPREIAFCSVTICGADLIYAPELRDDKKFCDFPFVVSEPHFRFYCSMPLITPEGYALGTICVMHFEPRELTFEQQEAMRRLAHQIVGLLEYRRRMIELDEAMRDLDRAHTELTAEKARSETLLHRILPEPIASEIQTHSKVHPRFYRAATILFADIKGFNWFTEGAEPATLVGMLDRYFSAFEDSVARNGIEKLKTIGDAFLAIAGVPTLDRLHVLRSCLVALEMQGLVGRLRRERERLRLPFFEIRIGLHTGPVIAGVVGRQRFTYDVWGDTVNVAAMMKAQCEPGQINVPEAVFHHAKPYFEMTMRSPVAAKSTQPTRMYFLDRLKAEFATDTEGREPSDRLWTHVKTLT